MWLLVDYFTQHMGMKGSYQIESIAVVGDLRREARSNIKFVKVYKIMWGGHLLVKFYSAHIYFAKYEEGNTVRCHYDSYFYSMKNINPDRINCYIIIIYIYHTMIGTRS